MIMTDQDQDGSHIKVMKIYIFWIYNWSLPIGKKTFASLCGWLYTSYKILFLKGQQPDYLPAKYDWFQTVKRKTFLTTIYKTLEEKMCTFFRVL